MADLIRTPKGKQITPRRYLALVQAQGSKNGTSPACEHGHFNCAAWAGGPCSNEVAAAHGLIEEDATND